MGKRLSETELQKSLDFCANVFTPVTPEQEQRDAERARVSKELLEKTETATPSLLEDAMKVQNGVVQQDGEMAAPAEAVAADQTEGIPKSDARHVIKDEFTMNSFESETLNGYAVRLAKGKLGLAKVQAA
jgi:flavine halogenase